MGLDKFLLGTSKALKLRGVRCL